MIRTEQVPDDGSCRIKCYLEPSCVSINVGPFDEVTKICELNDETDESQAHLALAERQGFAYNEVEVWLARAEVVVELQRPCATP